MGTKNKIWPARLHHLSISSKNPGAMVDWYQVAFEMKMEPLDDGTIWLNGKDRNLIISDGSDNRIRHLAFVLEDQAHLDRYRESISISQIALKPFSSPLLRDGAFFVVDPDGNKVVFGLPVDAKEVASSLPARLQHVVFRSQNLRAMVDFHTSVLGFRISDIVKDDDGDVTATFMRSDPEHHSLGVFRSPETRLDHFCSEATCWNDIRDWGDHFASLKIPITWGAGRHGAGNNLFIFVADPDGNNVEISAEIEHWTYEDEAREWKHEERTLNLWGPAWMRS